MEPNELPPLWALDMAAKAVPSTGWAQVDELASTAERNSVIAHARTLAKYEPEPVDEAELKRRQDAREVAVGTVGVTPGSGGARSILTGTCDHSDSVQAAYRMACLKDGTTPVPVEEWGK